MTKVPDFSENEVWIIQSTVNERYRTDVTLHLADAEVALNAASNEPMSCPVVFWDQHETSFVILKVGQSRFRCQFFGRDLEMYGPSKQEYRDLAECTVALLQVQADYERETQQSPASARRS